MREVPAEIPINLAVEDELSEHLLRVSLAQSGRPFIVGVVYGRQGNGYLKRMLPAFASACRGSTHLVMVDLDDRPCAPDLIEDWFDCTIAMYAARRHPNLIFRIAVREAESWVMADRDAFASFLGISLNHVPLRPDSLPDPKKALLDLVRKCRNRDLKNDIVPRPGEKRTIGPDYNGRLVEFVSSSWRASEAEKSSQSFGRTFAALKRFRPVLKSGNPPLST